MHLLAAQPGTTMGTPVAADVALSAHASRSLIDRSGEFNAFFEHPRGRKLGLEALKALGSDLVDLGEGWAWDEVAPRLRAGSRSLVVVAFHRNGRDRRPVLRGVRSRLAAAATTLSSRSR